MGPQDLLEILLVSALFYVIATAVQATRPRAAMWKIMAAAAALAATYVLARQLGLALLEQVLGAVLLLMLIGAVVAFQADIRRALDRAFADRASRRPRPSIVNSLTEAASHLAAERIGALIAIRGRQPWDHHLHGGVALNGAVSAPLLYSIFHPDTPGHDGAVLIDGDQITRFAVHLPLAERLPEVSKFGGTRHAAALGLSQECDALVIVVSEERGVISIAEDGQLTVTASADEVDARLRAFWRTHHPRRPMQLSPAWKRANLPIAAGSVVLASLLWFLLVRSPDQVFRSVLAPVEFRNLPEAWMPVGPVPTTAQLDVSGSGRSIEGLDSEQVTISIDLSQPRRGLREVVIDEANVQLPPGVDLIRARPAVLEVRLAPTKEVTLPVVVPHVGSLPEGLELVDLRADPATMTLFVPDDVTPPSELVTEILDLRQIRGTTAVTSRVRLPPDSRLPADAESAVVIRVRTRSTSGLPNERTTKGRD
jgi:uncharacterized protein (TIGR00159 family)